MSDDPLWPEFAPLWRALQSDGLNVPLVAGGYGLFLKQLWLQQNSHVPTVVAMENWMDATPRVTKDIDLVIPLELIANETMNRGLSNTLAAHGFNATTANPRWQFEKLLPSDRSVVVELHAPLPSPLNPTLTATPIRIKHKPSLGASGIHARTNCEAIGGELHPFRFTKEDLSICVPNPVTWSVMKLTAMKNCWDRSRDEESTPSAREFHAAQAVKHARDICRIAAMVTLAEREDSANVASEVGEHPSFVQAKQIHDEFFREDGKRMVSGLWREADMSVVFETLSTWF